MVVKSDAMRAALRQEQAALRDRVRQRLSGASPTQHALCNGTIDCRMRARRSGRGKQSAGQGGTATATASSSTYEYPASLP